jgi:hypothetical protein
VPTSYPASTNGMSANYKSLQFVYVARKLPFGTASLLALKDDFSRFDFAAQDTLKATPLYSDDAWNRYTTGLNLFGSAGKKITFGLSAFYQGGAYREGTKLNECFASASFLYSATPRVTLGPGVDFTSGNNGADPAERFQRFDPLYGTPHKFWGYMDYFYVADAFGPNGLVDYYLKTKFKLQENLIIMTDLHRFVLPEAIPSEGGGDLDKTLGTEIDLVATFGLTKVIGIEGGFSTMFSTATMAAARVKNIPQAKDISTWAYLMVSIKPETISGNQK